MMEGPRHQHLHQEWQEPLEEPGSSLRRVYNLNMHQASYTPSFPTSITQFLPVSSD